MILHALPKQRVLKATGPHANPLTLSVHIVYLRFNGGEYSPFVPHSLIVLSPPDAHLDMLSLAHITTHHRFQMHLQGRGDGNEEREPTHQIHGVAARCDREHHMVRQLFITPHTLAHVRLEIPRKAVNHAIR